MAAGRSFFMMPRAPCAALRCGVGVPSWGGVAFLLNPFKLPGPANAWDWPPGNYPWR